MNKLVICAIVSFFMAAMFFIISAMNYVEYLRELEQQQQQDPTSDFEFGRVILTDYFFRNFVGYALGGVIAALIGLVLVMLNRLHSVK